nr:CO(2)-response secreted protease [Ipomoea batatas]
MVDGASYHGQASGTARGGSPTSRIAMYRVCEYFGCSGSAILKAFDDGIKDGVDVLSLSLGPGSPACTAQSPALVVAIGAFHAVERGIVVVCSAGNSGPRRSTVVNEAPWIFTVAASTVDRDFQSQIVLGDNTVIKVLKTTQHNTCILIALISLSVWSTGRGNLYRKTEENAGVSVGDGGVR